MGEEEEAAGRHDGKPRACRREGGAAGRKHTVLRRRVARGRSLQRKRIDDVVVGHHWRRRSPWRKQARKSRSRETMNLFIPGSGRNWGHLLTLFC